MSMNLPLAAIEFWGLTLVALPSSAALAAVALIGYLFGQRTRKSTEAQVDERRRREVERASRIAWQLETIADRLRQDLAAHHSQVELFKRRLRQAQADGSEQAWKQLCEEAECVLGPTMQLAQQLSHAYDEIRQQSDALETFTHGRTDPLTGVGNAKALHSHLEVLFGSAPRGGAEFAVAMISLDRGDRESHAAKYRQVLPRLAHVIRACMRETDFIARLGEEEFVVVMPQTSLSGASVFGERVRTRVQTELNETVCCGAASVIEDDDAKSLLARADSALYSARATGPNRMFLHNGAQIREQPPNRPVKSSPAGGNANAKSSGALVMPAQRLPAERAADAAALSLVDLDDESLVQVCLARD